MRILLHLCLFSTLCVGVAFAQGVTYRGSGAHKSKHIVLIAGDDGEYHSEEALPALAKILAFRHGFTCTVLFSINPADGTIDPRQKRNIPGLETLKDADLVILFIRWRDLPDDQMKLFVDYVESGHPIISMRTGTHPFWFRSSQTYAKWSWNSQIPGWEGGFGRKVLGETWVAHHATHGQQSTRAVFASGAAESPLLRGVKEDEIWVPTEVYEVRLPMLPSCQPLLLGKVLSWMGPDAEAVSGKLNDPMIPVAWTNAFTSPLGKTARIFTTTMGSADDLETEGLRRVLVNAAYWALALENEIPSKADVAFTEPYNPHSFLTDVYTGGLKPSDLAKEARHK